MMVEVPASETLLKNNFKDNQQRPNTIQINNDPALSKIFTNQY